MTELERLEAEAYAGSFRDGLVDLFAGVSLVWIGAAWLWIEPLAGLAGILPAALAPTLVLGRRRFVEARAGYVSWSPPRRRWERRQLVGLLLFGLVALAAAVGLYVAVSSDADPGTLVAGLPAALLALPTIVLGFASRINRLLGYGTVLVVAAAVTIVLDGNPGVGLLVGGAAMLVWGTVLFTRFLTATAAAHA